MEESDTRPPTRPEVGPGAKGSRGGNKPDAFAIFVHVLVAGALVVQFYVMLTLAAL